MQPCSSTRFIVTVLTLELVSSDVSIPRMLNSLCGKRRFILFIYTCFRCVSRMLIIEVNWDLIELIIALLWLQRLSSRLMNMSKLLFSISKDSEIKRDLGLYSLSRYKDLHIPTITKIRLCQPGRPKVWAINCTYL